MARKLERFRTHRPVLVRVFGLRFGFLRAFSDFWCRFRACFRTSFRLSVRVFGLSVRFSCDLSDPGPLFCAHFRSFFGKFLRFFLCARFFFGAFGLFWCVCWCATCAPMCAVCARARRAKKWAGAQKNWPALGKFPKMALQKLGFPRKSSEEARGNYWEPP